LLSISLALSIKEKSTQKQQSIKKTCETGLRAFLKSFSIG